MTENAPTLPDQVSSIEIDASIDAVWAEITRRDGIQKYMFNSVLESDLTPGSRIRYYSPNRKFIFVVGEIVEIEPPKRLVHTYRFTDLTESETLVTWELEETGAGVRVTITHSAFTDQAKTHKKIGGGWNFILKLLKRDVETGDIGVGTKMLYGLMKVMMVTAPKRMRTEEVIKSGG